MQEMFNNLTASRALTGAGGGEKRTQKKLK
jgi:hypothetical protein